MGGNRLLYLQPRVVYIPAPQATRLAVVQAQSIRRAPGVKELEKEPTGLSGLLANTFLTSSNAKDSLDQPASSIIYEKALST